MQEALGFLLAVFDLGKFQWHNFHLRGLQINRIGSHKFPSGESWFSTFELLTRLRKSAGSILSQEFKYIVRVAGRDLDGTKKVIPAIAEIKGVGDSYANAMVASLKLDARTRLGQLTDRQLQQIEQSLKDPTLLNLPPWLLNRRKDIDSGTNLHRFGSDLDFMIKGDLDREKNILSWRGVRHSLGLKVRGQRTRTTGRKGRTVGVKKSSLQAAQAAQQAAANAEKK